jgi:hypothetical protein
LHVFVKSRFSMVAVILLELDEKGKERRVEGCVIFKRRRDSSPLIYSIVLLCVSRAGLPLDASAGAKARTKSAVVGAAAAAAAVVVKVAAAVVVVKAVGR